VNRVVSIGSARAAAVWCSAADGLQKDPFRLQNLCCHGDFGRLECGNVVSAAISQVSIGRAKAVEFPTLAVDCAAGTDVDEEGNNDNKPVMVSA
jgi:hypothetical protein